MQNAQTNFGALWNGSPQFATKNSLLSTSAGLNTKITTTSNVLQAEINAIVATGTTALWANYRAIQSVDLSGNNLSNANTITATSFAGNLTGNTTGTHTGTVNGNTNGTHTGATVGNLTGNVVGNLSNTNLTLSGQYSITETADVGSAISNYANYGTVNITGKGGLGGIVNITADVATPLNPAVTVSQMTLESKGNYGLITPGTPVGYVPRGGLVSITARQGLTPTPPAEVTSALFANGEIDLTAYSYGIVPGLIKMSAGANFMYAGAFSPITGIFGNNYIAATVANTMTAGLPPGGIPTLVGTNYFFATLGIGGSGLQIVGNRMQGGLGVDFLQPFPNGDLIIQSNANGTDTVVISGVKSLAMSNGGNITGVGNINLTTVNGAAYPPVSALNPTFNSVSTNQISTGASFISSINGLPMSAYTNVGDATFNSVSTNQISTGASFISSINGLPISAYTNVGDATFNSVSTSRISTARVWMSSINDSIYFTNQPNGNSISGINDLFAQTAVFNTSLASYGTFQSGSILAGPTRVTGLFRVTNGSGFNVATIDTAGAITGTSLAVSGAISGTTIGGTAITGTSLDTGSGHITGGVGSFTNTTASGSATVNNGLTVVSGGAIINGATNIDTLNGVNLTYTNANLTTAAIPTANITTTNTGVINAGAGSLALTYGSISFNGSPYAPTAGTSSDPTFNSISTNKISTAQVFLSSINGYAYVPGGSISQDPTFNSISTNTISTAQVFLSSINGVAYVPGGSISQDPTFNSISTNTISTAQVFLSSINGVAYVPNQSTFTNFTVSSLKASTISITAGLFFSTPATNYDITHIFTSTTSANYDAVSSITNNILNYQMNLTSLPVSFDMGGFLDITNANRALWLNKTIIYSGGYTPGQNPTLNLVGAVSSGDYFDVKNTSATLGLSVWNPYESGGFVMNITPGQYYRFTYTTSWAATANPTPTTQTSLNTFSLVQGWNNTTISTNNILSLVAGLTNIIGFAQLGNTNITDLTAQQITTSNSQTQVANISSANISTATVPLIFNTNFSGRTLTTSSITTSSIQMTGGLVFSTPSTIADISKFTSLFSLTGSNLAGYKNKILDYEFDTSVVSQPTVNYPFPTSEVEFFWSQVGTWGEAINTFQAGGGFITIILGVSTGIGTIPITGFCDFYNQFQTGGIRVIYLPGTSATVPLGSTYRFSWTASGASWSVNTSPSPISVLTQTNFNISQDFAGAYISTSDVLSMDATSIFLNAPYTQANKLNAGIGLFSTIQASYISSLVFQGGAFTGSNATFQALSTNTISTATLTTSNLNATNITTPTINTTNITASNLFASNTTTSSINIRTGVPSYITGNYSNNFVLNTYTNPPNVNVGLLTSQLQTFSSNPTFTYSGTAGTDVITLDSSNRVWLNTTLQSPATTGWFLTTLNATNGVRVNISTISGTQNNYSVNQQIANLVATTAAPIALYTSAGGFKGNIASGNVSLIWSGTDYNTTATIPFTGVNFINNTSLSQSISTFSITTTSNIQFNSGVASNVPSISFGGRTVEVFRQRLDGFVTNAGNFGKGDANATIVSPYGQTFPVSQYNCIVTQVAVNIYQQYSLALNEQAWTTSADGNGNWKMQFNLTTATIPNANNPNFYAIAGVTMIPYDLGHFSGFQQPTNLGEGAGPGPLFAEIQLSTVTTSTLTMLVQDNISITAGVAVPSFLGTGNIFIGGTNSTELVGDSAVVGGLQDVNIAALNGSLYLTGNSTIQMTASTISMQNYVDISGALFAPQVLGLSSINGYEFTGGSSWVGTATSDLDMCNYNITNVGYVSGVGTNALVFGSNFSRLTGASNIAIESATGYVDINPVGGAGTIYLSGSNIEARGNLDMTNYNINNLTSITSAVATMTLSNTSNIDINAPNIGVGGAVNANCNAISNVGAFSRFMISTDILQPIIQYGQETSSGSSGSVVITLPQRYTSVSSYVPFACMGDAPAAEVYVVVLTRATFEIGWQNGGGGTQVLNWHTMGT